MIRRLSRRGLLGIAGGAAASLPFARRAEAATGPLVTLRSPVRVFDSRRPQFPLNGAKLAAGEGIAVAVSPAYMPDQAESVFVNCTVTQTEGSGYLIIYTADFSGERPPPDTSNINWTTPGATLANLALCGVDGENSISIRCEGNGRTHFILDVQGYVRAIL